MGIRAARLYRKNTGVYFIRVLLSTSHSGSTGFAHTAKQRRIETVVADQKRAART